MKIFISILATLLAILIFSIIGFQMWGRYSPTGRTFINNWKHNVQIADDDSLYETKKKVEDTCRAMIATYTGDKMTYEDLKDSESEKDKQRATDSKIKANKTAARYNEYVMKNEYVWKGNIPEDIFGKLEYLE